MNERLARAIALRRAGDLEGARREIDAALADDPELPGARQLAGLLSRLSEGRAQLAGLIATETPTEVEASLGALIQRPREPAAWAAVANRLARDGRLEMAVSALKRALTLGDEPEHRFQLAILQLRTSEFEAAAIHLVRLHRLWPERADVTNNLGCALAALGRVEDARVVFEASARLQPESAAAWTNLAAARVRCGDVEQGLAAVEEAARLEPENAQHPLMRADILIQTRRLDDALQVLREILSRHGQSARVLLALGTIRHLEGKRNEAIQLYNAVVRLAPNDPGGWLQMGLLLMGMGEKERSLRCTRRGVACDESNPHGQYLLANALLGNGQFEQAVVLYQRVARSWPSSARLFNNLGCALHTLGRLAEAGEAFKRAMALRPDNHSICVNYGSALQQFGQIHERVEMMERARELEPENIDGRLLLAGALQDTGQVQGAQKVIDELIAEFGLTPKVALGKASLDENTGRWQEAIDTIRPLLGLKDMPIIATVIFARCSRRLGRPLDGVPHVERALQHVVSVPVRCTLNYVLGTCFDKAGDPAAAMAAWKEANDGRDGTFEPDELRERVRQLRSLFSEGFETRIPRTTRRTGQPVLIVGMPRSGTSLTEQILERHPGIFAGGELTALADHRHDYRRDFKEQWPGLLAELSIARVDEMADTYLAALRPVEAAHAAVRVTDKMPNNTFLLGLAAMLVPDARIIHCVRDQLDTCLSCYSQNFNLGYAFSCDQEHLGVFYARYEQIMAHWRRVLPMPILTVRYEDVVADLEGQTRRMLDFLELPFDPACLRFHESERVVITASHHQVRSPIYKTSVGRSERYREHLQPLIEACEAERALIAEEG